MPNRHKDIIKKNESLDEILTKLLMLCPKDSQSSAQTGSHERKCNFSSSKNFVSTCIDTSINQLL